MDINTLKDQLASALAEKANLDARQAQLRRDIQQQKQIQKQARQQAIQLKLERSRILLQSAADGALIQNLQSLVQQLENEPPSLPGAAATVYWGAVINMPYGNAPWTTTAMDTFESHANKRMSIVHWGQPFWTGGRYHSFAEQQKQFDTVRSRGAIPLLDWGAWDYSAGVNQPNFTLQSVIGGTHDAYIRQWATEARAWGKPFFLRYCWEMNLPYWPWSELVNNNRPGEYVQAWQHVHDLFTQVGATNATWVWCPNVIDPNVPVTGLYPGDGYVDWVAMDGYNWGTDHGQRWQSFAQVFGSTYTQFQQLAPGKPIMIAEMGCSENGSPPGQSKADWIRDAFATLPRDFPDIKAVVWFNWNANDPSLSWPIESSAAAQAAFAAAISSDYYAEKYLGNLSASPIPVLR